MITIQFFLSEHLKYSIENTFLLATGREIFISRIGDTEYKDSDKFSEQNVNSAQFKTNFEFVNSQSDIIQVDIRHHEQFGEIEIQIIRSLFDIADIKTVDTRLSSDQENFLKGVKASNPFFLAIDSKGCIQRFGENWTKAYPELREKSNFSAFFEIDNSTAPLTETLIDFREKRKILFFKNPKREGKFKATVLFFEGLHVLLVQPVVNAHYLISHYGLTIKDFLPHEYIAEFVFLQSSSQKALEESKKLLENIKQRNKEIESVSRFPSENPNPILRCSPSGEMLYSNEAGLELFNKEDFKNDPAFQTIIEQTIQDKDHLSDGQIEKFGKTYLYAARFFPEDDYLNIYLFEVTIFLNEIQNLNKKVREQKEFYEQILNGIPNDIAVFDKNHKYLFVNPQGIKDPQIREFMIGKDDFDYCNMKGISDDMAKKRREVFNKIIESGSTVEWEDEHINRDGKIVYVLRKMSPLFNEKNEVIMVIGYGLDITSRKEAELRLIESSRENEKLRTFIDRTKDAIQVADVQGQIVYMNDEAKRRLGFEEIDYRSHFVGEFEPLFRDNSKWTEHFNEMRSLGKLTIESTNINRETNEQTNVEVSINFEKIKGEEFIIAVSRDITEKKITELELEKKHKFQEILIEISNKYINVSGEKINETINNSLAFVGNFVSVDRVYVFDYDHIHKTSSNTFEWCADGIDPEIENLQGIPFEYIPAWTDKHFKNEEMHIENVLELEEGPLREILEPQGILSLLAIPMFSKGICIGFVGFDAVRSVKKYTNEERNLLRLFAEMLVNMFERTAYLKQIESARNEIENYNKYLEERVESETLKNVELTKSITEQEKLVTIGEISAGIAHDLNTPLGSILIGLESVDYSYKRIFNDFVTKVEAEEIHYLYQISTKRKLDLFRSTTKSRTETEDFQKFLEANMLIKDGNNQFARLFVQCQILPTERELIEKILSFKEPSASLELLYILLNLSNLIETSKLSANRATEVVKNLKKFVRSSSDEEFKEVNLDQNIRTVLSVFNHELKKNVHLTYDVDTDIMLHANEVKLFQLWSNLIKNALEAMEETDTRNLGIRSFSAENSINISISNTGEMIPLSEQKRIFDKFFTTKLNKSGSGLGLSIVQSVLEDHSASISLESNQALTTFTVSFKKHKNG